MWLADTSSVYFLVSFVTLFALIIFLLVGGVLRIFR